ncbi:MAG: hypothetical protein ACTSO2_19565 [Promethearchaeota archaeon]
MDYNNLPMTLEHRIFKRWVDIITPNKSGNFSRIVISSYLHQIAEDEVEQWYKEQEKRYPGMVHFEE